MDGRMQLVWHHPFCFHPPPPNLAFRFLLFSPRRNRGTECLPHPVLFLCFAFCSPLLLSAFYYLLFYPRRNRGAGALPYHLTFDTERRGRVSLGGETRLQQNTENTHKKEDRFLWEGKLGLKKTQKKNCRIIVRVARHIACCLIFLGSALEFASLSRSSEWNEARMSRGKFYGRYTQCPGGDSRSWDPKCLRTCQSSLPRSG